MASLKHIPTRQLGRNGPIVSAIGFGTMGIGAFYGKTDEQEAYKTLTYAADRGMTFWDCADIYGNSEETLGKWFTETGRRPDIFLATKFGAHDPELPGLLPDGTVAPVISTPSHIRASVARSLAKLKTDYIDLYYQHRVDPKVPIEVVLETLREYVDRGVIRWLGLSQCTAATLRRARAVPGIGEKVIAIQEEYSPWTLDIEKNGLRDAARELGVAVVAYSPLCRGLASGKYRSPSDFAEDDLRRVLPRFSKENFPKSVKLADEMGVIAKKYNATPAQVCLAWILGDHPDFFPIPGCRSRERVEENAGGAEIALDEGDLKEIRRLSEAAFNTAGLAYPDFIMKIINGNCIPLEEWKGE